MTHTVTTLTPIMLEELVEFDHDVLADLCARHGHRTEIVIATSLSQIEQLLSLARLQLAGSHDTGLIRTCSDLIALAQTIGMRTLERAAVGVLDCIDAGDATALPACAQRMLRLGEPETIAQWTVRHDTVA
ncbi:hypothetical protein [Jannaschia sp. 2305UL9-9]|uniref:hypothetical protein n=1 Tax=Jannaschia sp. 2305UL9-9 TaxID=3121638 RepID=UPI0035278BA6